MYHSDTFRRLRIIARFLAINKLVSRYFRFNGYEGKFNESLMSTIKETSIVWDIGANHGLYTDAFYKNIDNRGKIIAFEPNRDLATQLAERFHTAENVYIHNIAVSNFSGHSAFKLGSDDLEATSSLVDENGTYQVEVKKLSDLVGSLGAPHIVKIDIEGAETNLLDDILKNADIYRNIIFFMEVHFAIIEKMPASKEFYSNLKEVKNLSKDFTWIDASHLRFQI